MYGGITDKTLRVDLSSRRVGEEDYPKAYLQIYIGQDGLVARIIYNEVPLGIGGLILRASL